MKCSFADRARDKAAASAVWGSAKEAERDTGEEETQSGVASGSSTFRERKSGLLPMAAEGSRKTATRK